MDEARPMVKVRRRPAPLLRFKVVYGDCSDDLQAELNRWADELPEGTKIRRTQLAAAPGPQLWALINYELPGPYDPPAESA